MFSFLAVSWPEITEAIPIILSLIVIEGLLSVDNALAIAAMASHLPEKQKYLALKFGIIGAYAFRGVALLCATFIIDNPWLKIIGAAYLIHLMCAHFAHVHRAEEEESMSPDEAAAAAGRNMQGKGFLATVAGIELMDISLSVDNVVAAVVMSPKLWVVVTGVFIGILALRLVAGAAIKLIERFPILEHSAFLLIGYVGGLLIFELVTHIDVHASGKFIGIVAILGATIWYSRNEIMKQTLKPMIRALRIPMRVYATVVGAILATLTYPFRTVWRMFRREEPVPSADGKA